MVVSAWNKIVTLGFIFPLASAGSFVYAGDIAWTCRLGEKASVNAGINTLEDCKKVGLDVLKKNQCKTEPPECFSNQVTFKTLHGTPLRKGIDIDCKAKSSHCARAIITPSTTYCPEGSYLRTLNQSKFEISARLVGHELSNTVDAPLATLEGYSNPLVFSYSDVCVSRRHSTDIDSLIRRTTEEAQKAADKVAFEKEPQSVR